MKNDMSMQKRVEQRLDVLLEVALELPFCPSVYGATISESGIGYLGGKWVALGYRLTPDQQSELLQLHGLWRVYRVISDDEEGWVDLPADVAADLCDESMSRPWVIKHERGRDPGCGRAALNGRELLGGGATARWDDVRTAVDAAARRILHPEPAIDHSVDNVDAMCEAVTQRMRAILDAHGHSGVDVDDIYEVSRLGTVVGDRTCLDGPIIPSKDIADRLRHMLQLRQLHRFERGLGPTTVDLPVGITTRLLGIPHQDGYEGWEIRRLPGCQPAVIHIRGVSGGHVVGYDWIRTVLREGIREILGEAELVAPTRLWACAQCGATDTNLRFVGDRNIGCEKCLTSEACGALDRLGYSRPRTCTQWTGSGSECATCGVRAYDHPGAPTPASRGCKGFSANGPIGAPVDATLCEFCLLPCRDHRTNLGGAGIAWPEISADGGDWPWPSIGSGKDFAPAEAPMPFRWGAAQEVQAITIDVTLINPIPAACERACHFLGTLEYLPLSEERQASELRHRLRGPDVEVLKETIHFLGGVYPARPGQADLIRDLMQIVAPEGSDTRAINARRATRPGTALTKQQIQELMDMR